MASVHIAGPVMRPRLEGVVPSVAVIYKVISEAASNLEVKANLPRVDPHLEIAEPAVFFERVAGSIHASDVVITVFTGSDVSAGIEAGMASNLGKKQLLVIAGDGKAPRLLMGLPGVENVVDASDSKALSSAVRAFLLENLNLSKGLTSTY